MKAYYLSQEYILDNVACELIDHLKQKYIDLPGYVYYKFPSLKELDEESLNADVFIVTPIHGIVAFICIDTEIDRNKSVAHAIEKVHSVDSLLFSRLIKNKNLQNKPRVLKFELNVVLYAPNIVIDNVDDVLILKSLSAVDTFLNEIEGTSTKIENQSIEEILSTIEASSAIIKPKERDLQDADYNSKAYALAFIESQICKFDDSQRVAALSVLEGPQRIRGLAGTGKTIILCLKAANLHLMYPDRKIMYTFYTKSLYDYIHSLITRFYLKMSDGQTPNFDTGIHIRHAWGGESLKGVYYDICVNNQIVPVKFKDVSDQTNPFDYICKDLLAKKKGIFEKNYDFVLMDEAQDFMPSFYQLCRAIVKDDHLVWVYDELQNIFKAKLQDTVSTFKNEFGAKGIDLNKLAKKNPRMLNDIVLPRSYRNVYEILITAHALGFGIYNDKLIQSLENNNHWEDLGYQVISGDCSKEQNVEIFRPRENSPLSLPQGYDNSDIITYYSASDIFDECKWIADEIRSSIIKEKLKPDDIAVICLDDRNAKRYLGCIESELSKSNIFSNNLFDRFYQKGFTIDNHVTLSSVYKAKGNEAAMVFVIGADAFEFFKDDRMMRNKVFTSFTRAKVWLRITGVNIEKSSIISEIRKVKENDYTMKFYNKPTHKLQRDWDENSRRLELKKDLLEEFYQKAKQIGIDRNDLLNYLNSISNTERGEKQ